VSALARTLLTGIFALLPIALTIGAIVWVGQLLQQFAGHDSLIGRLMISLGLGLVGSKAAAYLIGLLIVLATVFALGLLVETRIGPWAGGIVERLIQRIPLFGQLYGMAKRFTSIVDPKGGQELKGMAPVWCLFGGEGGAAALALLPSRETVQIGGERYLGVLVPSAPVPFGGALIYVPERWVRPAEGGVETLMNVYVSMGVSQPKPLARSGSPAAMPPK
jgi:uncharacterized membrane protein